MDWKQQGREIADQVQYAVRTTPPEEIPDGFMTNLGTQPGAAETFLRGAARGLLAAVQWGAERASCQQRPGGDGVPHEACAAAAESAALALLVDGFGERLAEFAARKSEEG